MKKELKRSRLRASGCLLTVVSLASLPLLSHAANPVQRATITRDMVHATPLDLSSNKEVELFVRFNEDSVAEMNIKNLQSTGAMASPDKQKAQAARVSAQHAAMRASIEAYGAKILSAQKVGANGMRISVPASQLAALRAIPGVRSVGRVISYQTDNIDSVPWIGATKVWANLGLKGKDVKVGIIDSGIDYLHANLGGAGNPADFTANNPGVIEPGSFPTAKVKGGYDFAGPTYNATTAGGPPLPDADPLDRSGHGSHVAGTVAGVGVPGTIGPGVAPEADLYAIKVFGDHGGSTNLVSLGIEWAMDPNGDGDMSDHMDVINMSLGSSFGDPNDPSAISSANAAALGIVVVASAGNAGAVPYILGSPSVAADAISVAASLPGGRLYAKLTVTAPAAIAGVKPSVEGAGPVTLASVGPIVGDVIAATPTNGCAPLTNAAQISGKIALIARGTCPFVAKYQAAQAAGAKAIIVYNNSAADPIIMGLDSTITIPGVMTTLAAGSAMAAATGVTARLEVAANPAMDDQIANFSSEGPGAGSTFKPDLAAPGQSIISTAMGTGTDGVDFSGTSMAAPHVSGAAALLLQEHPGINQSAIKALLQNSTVNANTSYDTHLTRQGTGVIRVDRAAALNSYASPGGVSFGRLNPVLPMYLSEDIELTGLTSATRTFTSKNVPNHAVAGVQVTCPSSVVVRGKRATKTHIAIKFDPQASVAAGVFDNGTVSESEVDGWCVFSDGKDELRVGYIAVVDPASSVIVTPNLGLKKVTVRNFGPSIGWAEGFTLAKLGGETLNGTNNSIAAVGFRRADPAVYGGNVLELGVATERSFNHLSSLIFDMFVDTDGDGVDDVELLAIDQSYIVSGSAAGTYITLQFDLVNGGGFIDWSPIRSWDFNDRVAVLPFSFADYFGLLPEKFNYTLNVINASDSTTDVQHGSIDMSKEIVPDLNSFGVDPNDKIDVKMNGGTGISLWLFQNNPAPAQIGLGFTK
jgi:subtilisin family serine protease